MLVEHGQQILEVKFTGARLPHPHPRGPGRAQPGRRTGGKIQIGHDHFIATREIERRGEEVVRLGAARAETDFGLGAAEHLRRDFPAGLDLRVVRVATLHALGLVAPVTRQRLAHAHGRNTLRRGVEIRHRTQGRKIAGAAGWGEHAYGESGVRHGRNLPKDPNRPRFERRLSSKTGIVQLAVGPALATGPSCLVDLGLPTSGSPTPIGCGSFAVALSTAHFRLSRMVARGVSSGTISDEAVDCSLPSRAGLLPSPPKPACNVLRDKPSSPGS